MNPADMALAGNGLVGKVPEDAVAEGGARLAWGDVPRVVQAAIEGEIGLVVGDLTHKGGFSPALAATLNTDNGPVFVKAVSSVVNPHSADIYQREATVNRVLPPGLGPVMRWAGTVEAGHETWEILIFDELPGRQVALPWARADLRRVHEVLANIAVAHVSEAVATTLPDFAAADQHGGFATLWALVGEEPDIDVEQVEPWCLDNVSTLHELALDMPRAAHGDRIVHSDLRADNIVVVGDRAWAIDWPWAALGAPIVDALTMLPSVLAADGVGRGDAKRDSAGIARIDPDGFTASLPGPTAPKDDQMAILSALAAFFTTQGARPDVPSIPRLRAFQRAQGRAACAWLRTLLG